MPWDAPEQGTRQSNGRLFASSQIRMSIALKRRLSMDRIAAGARPSVDTSRRPVEAFEQVVMRALAVPPEPRFESVRALGPALPPFTSNRSRAHEARRDHRDPDWPLA